MSKEEKKSKNHNGILSKLTHGLTASIYEGCDCRSTYEESRGVGISIVDLNKSFDGNPVLKGINLEIAAGEIFSIIGPSGTGKSVLLKHIVKLEKPDSGRILIDGQDGRDVTTESLRNDIGLVFQDSFLFSRTVAENIAYGMPDATAAQIAQAAETAEASEFIELMPNGYDTVIGERGQKLSGGQRQRLSIARALLTDSPILLLDEATSAVDNETEAAIQRSLARVAHDRTVIVIAHRLSTIRHADRIYVVSAGEIIESGTHRELVDHPGIYRSLWSVQTGSAVGD